MLHIKADNVRNRNFTFEIYKLRTHEVCFRFKLQTHVLFIIYNENHISLSFTEIARSILL